MDQFLISSRMNQASSQNEGRFICSPASSSTDKNETSDITRVVSFHHDLLLTVFVDP